MSRCIQSQLYIQDKIDGEFYWWWICSNFVTENLKFSENKPLIWNADTSNLKTQVTWWEETFKETLLDQSWRVLHDTHGVKQTKS